MIDIILYKNGVEVKGHLDPVHCAEVSILTWNTSNSLAYCDEKSEGNSSTVNGYSFFTLDTENETSSWLFQEYKRNLKEWTEVMWKGLQYQIINNDDEILIPTIESA
jgi:hypothetical protein